MILPTGDGKGDVPVRDRSLPKPMIARLWTEVKDHAEDEISTEARAMLKELIEGRIDAEFEDLVQCGRYERSEERQDYRNGYWTRGLLTTVGHISGLRIPRARSLTFRSSFFGWYQRRQKAFDRAVRTCFVGGVSTRKVKAVTRAFTDAGISASTVSRILRGVDEELRAYRKRPIVGAHRFIFVDAVWMSVRKRYGRKSPVLFAVSVDEEHNLTLLGFKLAFSESQLEWGAFLGDLLRRGLDDSTIELIIHDGAGGIIAALADLFPYAKTQLCVVHKVRAAAARLRNKSSRDAFLAQANAIYEAEGVADVRERLDAFSKRWYPDEPRAVNSLRRNFGKTLVYMQFEKRLWKTIRTTNPVERYQQEVRRRTRPMRSFADHRSCERIIYAIVAGAEPDVPK
jgi:putative transposase